MYSEKGRTIQTSASGSLTAHQHGGLSNQLVFFVL